MLALLTRLPTCCLQIMVDKAVGEEVGGLKQLTPTSTCVLIEGVLAETPEGTKQKVRQPASWGAIPMPACVHHVHAAYILYSCCCRCCCCFVSHAEGREWWMSLRTRSFCGCCSPDILL